MLSSSLIYHYFHRKREQQDKASPETAGQRLAENPISPDRTKGYVERFQNLGEGSVLQYSDAFSDSVPASGC
jgi:hypothetical protein